MRVLVVDDSEAVRSRLVEILSTLQDVERVETAARASEARQSIQSAPPDVVVLDIHMPGGSGMEVLEALRANDQRIMTIVLTNDPTTEWRDASLRAGADFFFDKSAEFQQAIDVIARLALGRAAQGDPLPHCWTCFERLAIPSWIFDLDTLEFKAVNDAAIGRYGYSREEFLAMTMMDIRPPETVPAMMEEIARRRSGETVPWIGMRQHRANDGTPICVEVSVVPFDRGGRRLDLVLAHDISERILVEDALRASENRYRDLFENATDAIFTTDLDLNFTSLNSVAEALTGYTREEANQVNIAAVVTTDALETIQHELANQMAGKPASMFDTAILTRDGRSVPIEVNARLVYRDGKPVGSQGIARDISERKRLERQFQQVQKMDAIGQLAGGLAHEFNNLLTAILGQSNLLLEALPEDDPRRQDVQEIQKAGQSAESLTRQLLAFSRQQIVEPLVLDLNGLVVLSSEMTAATLLHHDLLDDLNALIWEADPVTFQFIYISRGAERVLGYPLEHWLTRPTFWADVLHPEDRDRAVGFCQAAVAGCRDHEFEYRLIAADGQVVWMHDVVRVICDAEGTAIGLRGVMVNITARKTAEAELHKKDRYYQALLEQTLDVITVIDPAGVLQYASPSLERVLGHTVESRAGRSVFEHIHPEDAPAVQHALATATSTNQASPLVRFRTKHADGAWRTLEAIGRPFVDDAGRTLGIVNSRDITERAELERQVRHTQKMEAMGRLTGAIAHDFNNVLQSVLGYTNLALGGTDLQAMKKDLGAIRAAAEIGATLTARLLAFSRRTGDAPELVDVHVALRDLDRLVRQLAGPTVEVAVDLRAIRAEVRISPGLLEQIIMNLAANAKDAMPDGGCLVIATETVPSAGETGSRSPLDTLVIEVRDTGEGIPQEIVSRIFDPYFTTKDPGKGTGLGLSIVYGILQDIGGRIDVESRVGQGTRFRVRLQLVSERPSRPPEVRI